VQITLDSIRDSLSSISSLIIDKPEDYISLAPAGVFLLVYVKNEEVCVLLNKRTDRIEHHKGEICFPGGAQDTEDATILDTALRETYEEMGIIGKDVEVMCKLDQVSTRSSFVITPFVGIIRQSYPFHSSQIEVSEVLEVPLSLLIDKANWREQVVNGQSGEMAYAYGEHLVWGATARILTQFLELIVPNLR